jgi:hypothetical protein
MDELRRASLLLRYLIAQFGPGLFQIFFHGNISYTLIKLMRIANVNCQERECF